MFFHIQQLFLEKDPKYFPRKMGDFPHFSGSVQFCHARLKTLRLSQNRLRLLPRSFGTLELQGSHGVMESRLELSDDKSDCRFVHGSVVACCCFVSSLILLSSLLLRNCWAWFFFFKGTDSGMVYGAVPGSLRRAAKIASFASRGWWKIMSVITCFE